MAVDVDEILLGAFEGAPQRAKSMFPPELPGYWKEAPLYKPDIKKAKELLTAAGFPDGFDMDIETSSGVQLYIDHAEVLTPSGMITSPCSCASRSMRRCKYGEK